MAQVQGPTPAKRMHDKASKIISITEAKIFYVRHSDADGAESITRIEVFGEADYGKSGRPEDRLMGIWANANLRQIQENLRLVTKQQAAEIIAAMEEKGYVREGKLAASSAGPSETLPDVGGAFEDLDGKGDAEDRDSKKL